MCFKKYLFEGDELLQVTKPCPLIPILVSSSEMRPFFWKYVFVMCVPMSERILCVLCVWGLTAWLHPQPQFTPGTQGSGYPADLVGLYQQQTNNENTHAHTRTPTQNSELPWLFHSWEQWRVYRGIQSTPHNCLTENPKLLMGTTLIFPFLKEALSSLISKCLLFQIAGGSSECLCVYHS